MFSVYKKIVSPESSPVLGPAPDANNAIEPFALCNYCCSNRNKPQPGNTVPLHPENTVPLHPDQKMQPAKYEFGHATHYVYGITSPRLLCEFETGTNP